jgi:hypothetical protein
LQYHQIDGNHQLIPITADHAIDELFPTASAVLAEMDMSLSRSAVFLTVEGGTFEDDEEIDSEDNDEMDDFSLLFSPFVQPHDDALPSPFYPLRAEELVDPTGAAPCLHLYWHFISLLDLYLSLDWLFVTPLASG